MPRSLSFFPAALILGCATLPVVASDGPAPPALTRDGLPNSMYADTLRAQAAALSENDRKAFFKLVRRQQRGLRTRIEEMTFVLEQARHLASTLEKQDAAAAREATLAADAQDSSIRAYKAMARTIVEVRRDHDPVTLDSDPMAADIYAGFQFSSQFRDPGQTGSFFSKSRPFVALDIRQVFRWPGGEKWLEAFGVLSFQSSSKEKTDAMDVITTSGHFRGEMGAWWMKSLTESVSWGLIGSVGIVGYSEADTTPDMNPTQRDQFRNRVRLGVTLRQEDGPLRGSVAEVAYVRDPLFLHQDRLAIRGKVLLTQFGSRGASGDIFMEGSVSKGRVGRDEAVLMVGLRLSTLGFVQSLGGGLAR